jgi:hypothetical protein
MFWPHNLPSAGASNDRADHIKTLSRNGYPDFVFAFHDNEEIGPRMLARTAKHTKRQKKPHDILTMSRMLRNTQLFFSLLRLLLREPGHSQHIPIQASHN